MKTFEDGFKHVLTKAHRMFSQMVARQRYPVLIQNLNAISAILKVKYPFK